MILARTIEKRFPGFDVRVSWLMSSIKVGENKMSAWKFSGDMIETLKQNRRPSRRSMELFDNGVDAEASRMTITVSSGSMTFTDNGRGCSDPNVMAQPYRSESKGRHRNRIARGWRHAGYGYVGRCQLIQTVTRNKKVYHRYSVESEWRLARAI